jgi:hypothetical protein
MAATADWRRIQSVHAAINHEFNRLMPFFNGGFLTSRHATNRIPPERMRSWEEHYFHSSLLIFGRPDKEQPVLDRWLAVK